MTDAERGSSVSAPMWFGSPSRPLFGWVHSPADLRASGAVVVCPTFGLEAAYSHRAMLQLAVRLAESGLAVVRFDYDGTGDSAGSMDDPDRVVSWLSSVRSALDVAEGFGTGYVAVVGLRLGATLAAHELASGGGAQDLVLWDPCASGRTFLREQRALRLLMEMSAEPKATLPSSTVEGEKDPDGSVETPGFVYGAETAAAMSTIAISETAGPLAERVLLLLEAGGRYEKKMLARLAMPHVETAEVTGQKDLLAESAQTPVSTLDRIVDWLGRSDAAYVPVELPGGGSAVVARDAFGNSIVERPVTLGPLGLFGVLTEPAGGAVGPTVVFPNTGRINHPGPSRMWTLLARRFASSGLRSLRFDLSGLGDSPVRPGQAEQVNYAPEAMVDLDDVLRSLCPDDPSDVVLVGLCSGSYHSIEHALRHPVRALCAVNPILTFLHSRPTTSVADRAEEGRQAFATVRTWTNLLPAYEFWREAVRRLPSGAWWILNRTVMASPPPKTFENLVGSGVDVLVVAGAPETTRLVRGEGRLLRALAQTGRFGMKRVSSSDHALFDRRGRGQVVDILTEHVVSRFAVRPETRDGKPDGGVPPGGPTDRAPTTALNPPV